MHQEKDIVRTIGILNEAGYGNGRIKIAYDEWNLKNWHHPWHGNLRRGFDVEARCKNDIAATYTMADALFSACFLNSCLRHSDIVEIACFAPVVNTRGSIFVHKDGILKRTTFYTFKMYTNMLEDYVVPINLDTQTITNGKKSTGVLDAILTSDETGKRFVYVVVNKDPEISQTLNLNLNAIGIKNPSKVKVTVLSGNSPDDYNEIGNENRVVPVDKELKVKNGSVPLPPHSLTMIRVEK